MSTEVQKCAFIWNLEDFTFSTKASGEPIDSPCFTVEALKKTDWTLKCYPSGIRITEYITVKLCRNAEDSGPDNVKINFRAFILASDGSAIFENMKERLSFTKGLETTVIRHPREDFFKKLRVISPSNTLTICCQVWESDNDGTTHMKAPGTDSKVVDPFDEVYKTSCEEISKEVSLGKICHLYPNKFFARTKLEVQRRTFKYHINDFSSLPNPWNKSFILDFDFDNIPPLLLTLHVLEEFKNVSFYIRPLVETMDEAIVVKCIVKFLSAKGSSGCLLNDSYLFSPSTSLIWKTSNFDIDQNLYSENENLILQFELAACNGKETSSIEELTYTLPPASLRRKRTIMDDFLQFYEKQKYCDVKLQIGNETVQAHRAVLCSRSTVFQKMFENEITDNKTIISDMDMITLKHMLQFMYTENIGSLQYEIALKLYLASDKYQYESLRKQCSLFLSSSIQSANVCEILSLSNDSGDEVLKTVCFDYIRLHANEVFVLDEWKSFVLNHVLLASEALGYVSSMIQKSYIENQLQ